MLGLMFVAHISITGPQAGRQAGSIRQQKQSRSTCWDKCWGNPLHLSAALGALVVNTALISTSLAQRKPLYCQTWSNVQAAQHRVTHTRTLAPTTYEHTAGMQQQGAMVQACQEHTMKGS